MHLYRQLCVASLLALGACEEQPPGADHRECSLEDGFDDGLIELSAEPLALQVCGDGQLWVQEGSDAVAVRELSVVVAQGQVLQTDDERLVLGVLPDDPELGLLVAPQLVPGERTRDVYIGMNLNANDFGAGPFDPADPNGSSDYQTSMTLYGADHRPVTVQVHFTNNGGGAWSMVPMATDPTHGLPVALGRAELQFSSSGTLDSMRHGTFQLPGSPELTWEAHLESPPGSRPFLRTTSNANLSGVEGVEQDGLEASRIAGYGLTRRGEVIGYGDDGRVETVAWILDGIEGWVEPVE